MKRSPLKSYRVGEKLKAIRMQFRLSQNQILARLRVGNEDEWQQITRERISSYELDRREPPLPVLLRYAQIAGVSTDVLIDDTVDLPNPLPNAPATLPFAPKSGRRRKE